MSETLLEQNRAFGGVIDILEALGIEYFIWGGVAVALYGEPRFTRDMDIVVRLSHGRVEQMARLFEEDGYYVSIDAIRDAVTHHFYFNVIHLETNIKIDFLVAGPDPILDWAFEHRKIEHFDEFRRASYIPPEAAILTKLRVYAESGSERHLRDIESILRVSGEVLDLAYIDQAAIRAGLFEHWRALRGMEKGETKQV